MFNAAVNVPCNNAAFSWATLPFMEEKGIHETMQRLYDAGAALNPPVVGQSNMARALTQSPQRINNWETRGISKLGALMAEELLGIRSAYVLRGEEPIYAPRGKSRPPLRRIRTWSAPDELPEGQYLVLRRIEAALSAGPFGPSTEDIEEHELGNSFRADYAARAGWSRETHYTMRVDGRSMEPTIQDRSPVVIATNETVPVRSGCIYAIRLEPNAQPLLKRLDKLPGGRLRVRSDNPSPEYAPFEVADEEIEIIGRAVWTSYEL